MQLNLQLMCSYIININTTSGIEASNMLTDKRDSSMETGSSIPRVSPTCVSPTCLRDSPVSNFHRETSSTNVKVGQSAPLYRH
jgi:hypothetical protein